MAPPPEGFEYLWAWFCALSRFRSGPRSALMATEMEAWARLVGIALEPFEADTLMRMDRVFLDNLPPLPR